MELLDARAIHNGRRRGRRMVSSLGLVGLLAGALVVVGAGAAGAAGPGSVSGVSVSLSTNAAGANEVDYTAGFTTSATGALSNTGTITLSTSGATTFASNCSYTVTDVTTSTSTNSCPTSSPGSTVTISTGITIHHGDSVKVGAVQVANAPSSGAQTLTVSTSADLAASTSFSLVAASPVSGVSVSLSTNAAGANEVDYTAGFTTSATGALDPNNGTITLSTSGATVFSDSCDYTVTDVTTNQSGSSCPTGSAASSVTIGTGGLTIRHGDTVHVSATAVANAPSSGAQTLSVSTSSDLAASTSFSLVTASHVSGVSVSLSTSAAGAGGVNYTIGLTTSATGALDPNNGTITFSTSGATVFADSCNTTVTDVTTNQSTTTCPTAYSGSSVTIGTGGLSIRAGDTVHIGAADVENAPSSGSQTLSVSTSSDVAASTPFSLVAASPVTGVSVSLSTNAAGASEVDYTAGFTTSATGALDSSNGTITLSTSGATVFSSSCDYTLTDVTTNQSRSTCPTSVSGSSVTIETNNLSIRAGDTVHVGATEVQNAPSSGSQTLSVSTSSDTATSKSFSLVAASPVSGVSVGLTTNVAGASGVNYTIGFTTSATGALDPNNGTITFSTSGATVFADSCNYTVTDVTTNQSSTTCPTSYSPSAVTIDTGGLSIRAGDTVHVGAVQVQNAPSSGSQTLSVSTSSDLASSTSFSLVAGSHVSGVSVGLSTNAAGASEVDYTIGFTTSASGALDPNNGTIALSTSGATAFGESCDYTLTDVTTNQSVNTCPTSVSGSSVTLETGGLSINDGDTVQVGATEVQNAPSSGSQTLSVSTSSDTAGSTSFSLVAASHVSGVSVSPSTNVAGASGVDYTIGFTTSGTGALDPNNGTIAFSTSGATVFPSSCNYTLTDVTTNQSTTTCSTSGSGSTITIETGGLSIRAGDTVQIGAVQVQNAPSSGSQTFTLSTSSDLPSSTSYSLAVASPVSGVSVNLSTNADGASEVDYTVGFTTSATGALDPNNGTIIISTSGPTAFSSNCNYTLTDVTTNQSTTTCPNIVSGSSVTLETGGLSIHHGDTVQVSAVEVKNAPASGSQTLSASTSSDTAGGTSFSLVAASPVSSVSVKLSSTKASAKAKYTVAFTTSATGALDPNYGTITMVGPSGTVFPSNCSYAVTDVTTNTGSTACGTLQTNGVVITNPGLSIRAGDKVSVVVAKVKNAKTKGKKTLSVSTSSDLAAKGKFTLT